ncbi:hypothetical protein [Sphingomonas sp. AX6]|uniref:hypothetical protein n=1 Tax=Sphingomonas sp. AX6 TaxID=2653171 RepID=UPI0012EF185A|nr:hypothetical protein [Sphingomonas sp. AX6]VXC91388.1 conserved membrane hypothetical protein [Sphingomonas sp. AX6]
MTGLLPDAKAWLIDLLGMSKDALHVHIGLAVFFGAMLLFRRRIGDGLPWMIVLAVALIGEAWDIRDRWAAGVSAYPAGHIHDVINTLFWPTLITIFGLMRGRLKRRR